ncbi:hypothetical protein G7K_4749-t1 [Saitoella complicata NRRL Y-17804]|uniref:Uncharacterized protein n=1 Tax=Saitoella complicata (strain BCRC 22490 / CBS 7301 / JCM 7358 / NBRC 10748 / NRRL Y-17804) TaxID=698492 RepID=A0A0E9NMH4_SAICN|nr:hypothetical protein G7K_4749-t1 [Saitoella complicata NRRL Y-17804]
MYPSSSPVIPRPARIAYTVTHGLYHVAVDFRQLKSAKCCYESAFGASRYDCCIVSKAIDFRVFQVGVGNRLPTSTDTRYKDVVPIIKRFACDTCEFDVQLNIDGRRCLLEQLQHAMHLEQILEVSQSTMAKFPWATPMQRTLSPLPWVEFNSCSLSRGPEEESGGEASPHDVDHVQFVRELAESGCCVVEEVKLGWVCLQHVGQCLRNDCCRKYAG